MAWATSGTTFSSSPPFIFKLEYSETARTATSATYSVKLYIKINKTTTASFYGYPMSWSLNGGTATQFKSSSKWYGGEDYRTFTKSVTVSGLTAASGTAAVKLAITSSSGGSASYSNTYNFTRSSFNTAPKWASGAVLTVRETNSSGTVLSNTEDGTENAKKVAENISAIYLTWPAASDSESNVSKYQLECQIDDGTFTTVYSGTSRSYTHSIGSGSSTQGKKYDYRVKAIDSYSLSSSYLDSVQFQKNKLTAGSISSSGTLPYTTSSSQSVTLTVTAGSNTKSGGSLSYKLSSSQITIYNPTKVAAGSVKLAVYSSGTAPTVPYVKQTDLINLFKGSSYKGTFTLTLTTSNGWGSSATKSCSVSVDLRTAPNAATPTISGGYTKVNGTNYLIPAKSQVTLSWSGASCKLGSTGLKYDVQYSINGGTSYTTVASNTTSTTSTFKLNAVTAATAIIFRVITKTAFNYTANKTVSSTLHYYNAPTITFSSANRTANGFSVVVATKTNSSISLGWTSRSYTGKSTTATNITSNSHTINDTGLSESSKYTIKVTVTDNSGLTEGTVSKSYNVVAMNPMFSIRENGVGVNTVNTGPDVLRVNGTTKIISAAIPNASSGLFVVDTVHDANGVGNQQTLLGWNNSGKYCHYFRGTGSTYVDTLAGMQVKGPASFSSTLTVAGATTFNGAPTVNGTMTVKNTSSGIAGTIWCGTGGIVLQGEDGANLHLGAYNSSNDIVVYEDHVRFGKYVQMNNQQLKFTTANSAYPRIGYESSTEDTFISGAGNNWLRLKKDGSITWKGSKLAVNGDTNISLGSNGVFMTTAGYVVLKSNATGLVYLQGSGVRCTKPSDPSTYVNIIASAHTTSSTGASKTKIKTVDNDDQIDTMQILKDTNVYTYHLKDEVNDGYYHNKKIGFIAEATPRELKMEGEQAIDLYSMSSTLWDVCKKQQETIESQQAQIDELWEMVNILCDNQEAEELIAG